MIFSAVQRPIKKFLCTGSAGGCQKKTAVACSGRFRPCYSSLLRTSITSDSIARLNCCTRKLVCYHFWDFAMLRYTTSHHATLSLRFYNPNNATRVPLENQVGILSGRTDQMLSQSQWLTDLLITIHQIILYAAE